MLSVARFMGVVVTLLVLVCMMLSSLVLSSHLVMRITHVVGT